jgi:hypothetical protein
VRLHADDTVLVAALAQALVDTATRSWREQKPPLPRRRPELLRLAGRSCSYLRSGPGRAGRRPGRGHQRVRDVAPVNDSAHPAFRRGGVNLQCSARRFQWRDKQQLESARALCSSLPLRGKPVAGRRPFIPPTGLTWPAAGSAEGHALVRLG